MVDIQTHYLYLFCQKWCPFIDWPLINSGHFGFSTHNAMSKIFSDNTTMYTAYWNPLIDTKNTNLPLLCRKWYEFIAWPWTNGSHLEFFTNNAMFKILSDKTTMYGIPENPMINTKNTNLPLLCRKWYEFIALPWTNGCHLEFFTHNAMTKIFSDNTTMYGIPENRMIDTNNTNLPVLCRKWYEFIAWPWTNGGHLGFYPQCNVQSYCWPHH